MSDDDLAAFVVGGAMLLLVALCITAVLVVAVRSNRADDRRRWHSDAEPEPVCGCGHRIAYHDLDEGTCSQLRKIEAKWNSYGDPIGFKYVPCECRQYDGPVPAVSAQLVRELGAGPRGGEVR